MTTTKLSYKDYYITIRKARNCKWQREWENNTSKLHYNLALKNGEVFTTDVGNMGLS